MKIIYKRFHSFSFSLLLLFPFLFSSCGTTKVSKEEESQSLEFIEEKTPDLTSDTSIVEEILPLESDTITLLFAGDIMAHSVNYNISDYPKIWRDVKYLIEDSDLAFANIEAPIDDSQKWQSYPNFNMPQAYVEAAVDAGFDVFSLCNNHTNDQGLKGIKESEKSSQRLIERSLERNENIYFSGLKDGKAAGYTFNLIEKNGWKILFLPITEILNRPSYSDYINYVENSEKARKEFIKYVKALREANACDLMVLSIHAYEVEYTRNITDTQDQYYMDLLEAGVDILWANHAHIIKDRKYIFNNQTQAQKIIMYANGNTISGQRTAPELNSKNPVGERDNTGDGLMVKLTFQKQEDKPPRILASQNIFITTYINTANEYVVKPMNQDFIDYLWEVPRKDWARYIQRRIEINNKYTKDYIVWQ